MNLLKATLLLFGLTIGSVVLAQGPNCNSADPFCTGTTVTFPAGVGVTDAFTAEPGNNYGCLGSAPNPAWYYMEIDTGGDLEITMSNSNNLDIDFAMWGPFPDLATAMSNCGSLGPPVDCSYSTTATEVSYLASTNPGEVYLLLVTNFSNSATDISFTNTGGTATTDCSIVTPCNMDFLQVNIGACDPGTNTYTVSGWVDYTDPPTTGQLIIEDCFGNQDIYNPPFGATQTYSIPNLPSDGAPCSITAYFTDDPGCTINLNYNAPPPCTPSCFMTFLQVNIGACNTATGTYDLDGWVDFTDPPTTGQLIIEDCWGNQDVYNAPFGTTQTYTIPGLPADGAPCDVTAYFTADPTCTINLSYTAPAGCACSADAGTSNAVINGNSTTNYVLCYLDQIDITSAMNGTDPEDQFDPFGPTYDPGIWYLVYSCPPTLGPPSGDINADPCLLGVFSTTNGFMTDINDGSFIGTLYYVPVTMYSMVDGIYSYYPPPDYCYDLGTVYPVTYLEEITYTDNMTCGVGWDVTITGGDPAMFGTNFTLSNLVPAYASFSTTTLGDGQTVTITGLQNGDLVSFDVVDVNGCPLTVNLGPFVDTPVSDAGPDDVVCGLTYNLAAVPSLGTGTWTGPGTFTPNANDPNATVTVGTAGTYTFTWTEVNGACSDNDAVDITFVELTMAFSTFDETCAGACDGSATVIPAGGTLPYTYTWSGGTGGPADPNTTGLCTGNYDLVVTDANGCTVDTLGFPITGPLAVQVNSITFTDESCGGACDGTTDATVSGGTTPYTYSWTGPGGPYATEDLVGLCAGTYDFTVTDFNGCADNGSVTISAPAPVTLSVTPDTTICIGGTATLTATAGGGTPGYTYLWDDPGASTTATITVAPGANTTYTVIATDANGCASAPMSINVDLNPPLSVTALSDQTICDGGSANITANASGGDGGPYTYSWDNGAGVTQSPTVNPTTTTTYTVTVTDGCETPSATDAVTITVEPSPVPAFTVDVNSGCAPLTVTFTDNTVPAAADCLWDFGDGTTSSSCGTATYTYNTPGCYTVTLTLTSPGGCVGSTTIVDMVCVFANPVADFSFGPQPTTVLDPYIWFTDQSTTNVTGWTWDFAGLGSSVAQNPGFQFPNDAPGTYQVCLDVVTADGCTDNICQNVIIGDEISVYVPNTITVDGDGINDVFVPIVYGIDPLDYELLIFNRWGELIFEAHNPGIGWDGTYKGSMVQQDVYVWKLHVKDVDNADTYEYYGHVTVLK